jgi:hypothetical protein
MKFAVSKGEKELSELTARLFDIKGRGGAEAAKKAEAALLEANPHISDLSKVPEGTLIIIPDIPDGPAVKAAETAGIETELQEHLKATVEELDAAFVRSLESEEKAAAASRDLLTTPEVKEFRKQSTEANEAIEEIIKNLKSEAEEAKATEAAQKEALAKLKEAVAQTEVLTLRR